MFCGVLSTTKPNELKDKQKDKKEEDIPTAEKDELNDLDKKWDDLKSKKEAIFIGYASNNKVIRQLIDLDAIQVSKFTDSRSAANV